MKKYENVLVLFLLIVSMILYGCVQKDENCDADLLSTKDLVNIKLSAPRGSGAIRTLTLHYKSNGEDKYDTLNTISRIDSSYYDDLKKVQTLTSSDNDKDGIVDIIVYREFWFPDIKMSHVNVPFWPTVYEYSLKDGFIVASSKHKDYFEKYIKLSKDELFSGVAYMSDSAILAQKRLVVAAEHIVDGSFTPQSLYNGSYYEDVYKLTKDLDD